MALTDGAMRHIVRRHSLLDGHELAIMRAVEVADTSCEGNMPDCEVHWAKGLGPAKWLAVVVSYDDARRGTIKTAYPSRRGPQGKVRL